MMLALATYALLCGAQTSSLQSAVDVRYHAAEKEGFSGSVLVVKAGKPVLSKGYGFADPASAQAITPTTRFPIGSITKWFTGMVMLKLEEEGKLSLSDPISKYIDGVPSDKAKVVLRQLISHSAGFGEYIDRPGEGGDFAKIDKETARSRILSEKLKFAPGSKVEYSNVGYTLLAMVIEKAAGVSYEEAVRKFVLKPAQLTHTGFFGEQNAPATEFAQGLHAKTHGKQNSPYHWGAVTWSIKGAGGIVSTSEDMGRVIRALTQGKIVSMTNEPRMFAPLAEEEGFGWMIGKTQSGSAFCNVGGGDDFGFQAAILYLPKDGNLVITCSNSDTPNKMREANLAVLRMLK